MPMEDDLLEIIRELKTEIDHLETRVIKLRKENRELIKLLTNELTYAEKLIHDKVKAHEDVDISDERLKNLSLVREIIK